ncbi:putative E3 ubiquitin-protein ligase makorin-1 [Branchiostoma floridae x Branchiostoma japonicum]
MAAATPREQAWTRQVLCRFFVSGICRYGDTCRYSHDQANKAPPVCRFFLKNQCAFGDKCRFAHVSSAPDEPRSPSPTFQPKDRKSSLKVKLTDLKSQETGGRNETSPGLSDTKFSWSKWTDAAEFVPGQPYRGKIGTEDEEASKVDLEETRKLLCPYAMMGSCRYGDRCIYTHGLLCELCGSYCLHPNDPAQQSQHMEQCVSDHEKDMEHSFAVARSKDIQCGICMEVIWDKTPPSERRFGILSNCNHPFCLSCIRKWRSARQFEKKIVRSCPECRVKSDFVTPSQYWVVESAEKTELIGTYKVALSKKPCKYFNQGKGTCPFGGNCFYLHAYPDGRKEEPKPPRKVGGSDGRFKIMQNYNLWDFFEQRSSRHMRLNDDDELDGESDISWADSDDWLDELLFYYYSGGDDSELSDFDDD